MHVASIFRGTIGFVVSLAILSTAGAQYSGGSGTADDPYRIATAADLIALGETPGDYDKHFILTADIDLDPNLPGRKVFDRAVIGPDMDDTRSGFQGNAFVGVFDGNGHTISYLTIAGDHCLGLFGRLGLGASISNLALEAVNVHGTGNTVGGLVGWNEEGSILSCYSTALVSGGRSVGGLVGVNAGSITSSYSTGSVSGEERVGGLVGNNYGDIAASYSAAAVSGDEYVGGLAGQNYTGSVTSSLWDVETSALTISGAGVGLTTAEMMDPYMLGLNGFANDPNWILDAGRDYPRLAWEGTAGRTIPEPIVDWLDGQGTEEEPYRVDTADQLMLLSRASVLWDKHFVLVADIDLDPNLPGRRVFSQAVIQVFSGVFDGNGHVISHVTIVGDHCVGLFGRLGPGVIISNLALEAVNVHGTGHDVGGLVGHNDNPHSDIRSCSSAGTVNGEYNVGGLVGYNGNGGSITSCSSTGAVGGDGWNVGGLAGSNGGSIADCSSTGTVSGDNYVGGLVGRNNGSIAASYSTGSVRGADDVGGLTGMSGIGASVSASYSTCTVNGDADSRHVGGLVGRNHASITSSHSTGAVRGQVAVGGLVGDNEGSISASYSTSPVSGGTWFAGGLVGDNSGVLIECFGSGAVSGGVDVGGLVGDNRGGDIIYCYSTSVVDGRASVGGLAGDNAWGAIIGCYSAGSANGSKEEGGGLVGFVRGYVYASFWDIETSGLANMCGPRNPGSHDNSSGRTTAQMHNIRTYLSAGWDFVGETENGLNELWQMPEEGGYPSLAIFNGYDPPQLQGEGTGESPYLITNALELGAMVHYSLCAHYRLAASIDLSGVRWSTPVLPWFAGTFDGSGHTISHLMIAGGNNAGLFGELASGAEVRNLGVVDVSLTGSGDCVGGLAGRNEGAVIECYSIGSVSGNNDVGGLVGYNYGYGSSIAEGYSAGSAAGSSRIGGLVGYNSGTITQSSSASAVSGDSLLGGLVGENHGGGVTASYSGGSISGGSDVGGLVGQNTGDITNCYNLAAIRADNGVGGIVGNNTYYSYDRMGHEVFVTGDISRCYSAGTINGASAIGGLVGSSLTGLREEQPFCTVKDSFWDVEVSGVNSITGTQSDDVTDFTGSMGKATAEMQSASTFLNAGWDFIDETENGTDDIWWIDEGQDYPRLWWELTETRPTSRAVFPHPPHGAADVIVSPVLSWMSAATRRQVDIYFGDDEEAVASATTETPVIYRGRQPASVATYEPGLLSFGRTCYWRIDVVDETDPNSPWQGDVWSFTTIDYVVISVVDDFESYSDDWKAGQAIWQTWIDGFFYVSDPNDPNDLPSYEGNGTGATVGNLEPPFAELNIVHDGEQSMPMEYDNVDEPWYSKAERTWEKPQDWAVDEADTLTLYFRGKAYNDPEPLYLAVEDSAGHVAGAVHPDAEAVLVTEWQKWHIALADLQAQGLDVASVKKMTIGVGDRDNPEPGGAGRIYIDDIRVTNRMP